ncbi:AAA family ATPase [Hymenobacter sp. BT507]|uniref:AAA family ATPase n=1 Tax=Hymenobacter citatus TaxID=2763506 RepID=A0ABR7MMW7_9BACT|nr:AAA family ATPase [Hymenobacter citatus]MBC6612422.1 AAA family ATPase [Hymenobacter citatus]
MSDVRLVAPEVVEQFFDLVRDVTLQVQPFSVHYQDFFVTADNLQPLVRTNAATFQLRRGSAEAGQWATQRTIRMLLRQVGNKLEHAFQYARGWRHLVYDIGSAWQTETEVLIGFRMISGSAGRNRWFGRRDSAIETRSPQVMANLTSHLRQELTRAFAKYNDETDTGLPDQWLTVVRLPLTTPTTLVATTSTKSLLLRQLSQALVLGEVLRRQSFDPSIEPPITRAMPHALNQILYGPPGTGKTYSTSLWALTLLNPNNLPLAEVKGHYGDNHGAMRGAFEQFRRDGQIGFVSFHQSFGYEDFVEGIKPGLDDRDEEEGTSMLQYHLAAGIFKRLAERAIYGLHLQRQLREQAIGTAEPVALDFETLFSLFSNQLLERLQQHGVGNVILPTISNSSVVLDEVTSKGTLRFYHQNGDATKTFAVSKTRLEKVYRTFPTVAAITNVSRDIVSTIGGANTTVYWAAFRALKEFEAQQLPTLATTSVDAFDLSEQLRRAVDQPEVAASVARDYDFHALTAEDYAAAPRFVLIIDEINRGNVASIFGELISLLEEDKRGGQANELRVTLPYSKESFTVPPNLFVLGTMNTADRSVEALDTALRRRFSFHELAPQPQELPDNVEGINVQALLTALNERLETLLDRDHRLGHAWLLQVRTVEDLRTVFQQKIIPQLQEYFYGQWARLGQVLGTGFVRRLPRAVRLLPGFEEEDLPDEPRYRYDITPVSEWTAEVFRRLYAS